MLLTNESDSVNVTPFVAGLAAGVAIEFRPFRPSVPRTPLARAANLSGHFYCPDCSLKVCVAEQTLPSVLRHNLAEKAGLVCGKGSDKATPALGWSTEMPAGHVDSLEKDDGPHELATAGNSLIIWINRRNSSDPQSRRILSENIRPNRHSDL